jgi:tripartite-type tricarboxylate transporter receptor subunit TctC
VLTIKKSKILLATAVAACCFHSAAAFGAGADFSGKTITVAVAYAAGGPVDMFARVVGSNIGRHLQGNPAVVIQNMPGAGGVVAANYLYNLAKKDGTVIGVTISPFATEYIDRNEVRFESNKFYWLGALNVSQGTYVNGSLGVKTVADLVTTKNQIVIGGLSAGSARDLRMRSFLESLGIRNYKYVAGYSGTQPVRLALLRNEVNFSDESIVALAVDLASEVKAGKIIPLVQTGINQGGKRVPDRSVAIPTAQEAVVSVRGSSVKTKVEFRGMLLIETMMSLGRAVLAPPGIEPAAGSALRTAFDKLRDDAQFRQAAERVAASEDAEFISGADAQNVARDITNTIKSDPEAVDYLRSKAQK